MRPDTASSVIEVVRAAEGVARAEAVRAVGIEERVRRRSTESQWRNRHPAIETCPD